MVLRVLRGESLSYASAENAAARFQAALNRPSDARLRPRPATLDNAPLTQSKTELVEFATAPFPYQGVVPGTDRPFLNVVNGEQKDVEVIETDNGEGIHDAVNQLISDSVKHVREETVQ